MTSFPSMTGGDPGGPTGTDQLTTPLGEIERSVESGEAT